jgi:hypothetical protein
MRAPTTAGSYRESWELIGPDGLPVPVSDAPQVDVRLVVSGTGAIHATAPECAPGDEIVTFMNTESVNDGSTVAPGAQIPKEWTLLNKGLCTWPAGALRLKQVRSEPEYRHPKVPDVVTDRSVPPQGTYTFLAPFLAPRTPRHYRVHWQMYNRAGDSIRISRTWTIWADINVRGPTRK